MPRTPRTVPHPTLTERVQAGRDARKRVPRTAQAVFEPGPDRPDPVALLESQAATRVASLIPIRYGRMSQSQFAFFRGGALVMAADLATTPDSGLTVQACGDAHLSNFGAFGSPERNLVFDINDFDETNPGPWEWDVKRLITSIEVAARDNGFADSDRRNILLSCAKEYRDAMTGFASMDTLALWYERFDATSLTAFVTTVSKPAEKRARKNAAKAHSRDSMQAFTKYTQVVDGRRRIVSEPPLVVNMQDLAAEAGRDPEELSERVRGVVRRYRRTLQTDRRRLLERFELVDLARKVVGVGSVGTRCFMALFLGRDNEDPLFLQVKEAQPSVLEAYTKRSEYPNMGQRVVAGQRLMQSASDIFLGWDRVQGIDDQPRDFYVRQLRDWKGSAAIDAFGPDEMQVYARMCAWTLAKAHARSGDAVAIASYAGKGETLDQAMADFAATYADQNARDHQALVDAITSGRVQAQPGI